MGNFRSKFWRHFQETIVPNWFICKYCDIKYKKKRNKTSSTLKRVQKMPQSIRKDLFSQHTDRNCDDMDMDIGVSKSDNDADDFSRPSSKAKQSDEASESLNSVRNFNFLEIKITHAQATEIYDYILSYYKYIVDFK